MLNELAKEIHENAKEHGWWEGDDKRFGEIIALCHSELSEALEEYRNGRKIPDVYYSGSGYIATTPTKCCNHPKGIAVELADCIIRILDYCGKEGIDIEGIIRLKHEYNKTRPHRHGGKVI